MRRSLVSLALLLAGCASAGGAGDDLGSVSEALSTTVVISQVYGGAGSSGAIYSSDFVELFNRGSSAASISGWSIQYASATGTSWSVFPLPAATIPAGGHYLIQLYTDASSGSALASPDATGTLSLAAASGRIALANKTTAISCTLPPCATKPAVIDYVGYGLAFDSEGSGPAPIGSTLTAVLRKSGGCTETDDNANDFSSGIPTPRNSGSAVSPCGPVDDAGPVDTGEIDTGTVVVDTGTVVVDTGTVVVDTGSTTTDSSTPSDATATDSATSEDATSDATGDAANDASEDAAIVDSGKRKVVEDLPTASPCGCRTPGGPVSAGVAPMLLGLLLAARRKRR